MPGFFNQQNATRRVMQYVNVAGAAVATYDLMTNPASQQSEVGLDLATHFLNLYLLGNDNSAGSDITSITVNSLRLGSLFSALTTGCSSVPIQLNLLDTGIHTLTLLTSMFIRIAPQESTERQQHAMVSQ